MENNAPNSLLFSWSSEVKDSELDSQGIVNNALYFVYMEHCRHQHLKALNLNFFEIQQEGIDLLVRDCQIKFRASLTSNDHFTVTSCFEIKNRFKIIVPQEVIRQSDNKVVVHAVFTITGINRYSRKLELPARLIEKLNNN